MDNLSALVVGPWKGGGPAEHSPALAIGSIFYDNNSLVHDPFTGDFDEKRAARHLQRVTDLSTGYAVPGAVDVIAASPEAMVRYLEFVASRTPLPLMVNGTEAEVRLAGLEKAAALGILDRLIFASLMGDTEPAEVVALKRHRPAAVMVLAANVADPTPEGAATMLREQFLPIKEKDDIERIPALDPSKGRIPHVAKEISLVKQRFDNELVVAVVIAGPLTAADLLRGPTELLMDMEEDPAYVHRLLRLTTDAINRYVEVLAGVGAHAINMLDPVASSDVISPEQYREFGFPYHKEVMEHIKGTGAVPLIHICTYTQPIWEDMANTGAFGIHGDFQSDMVLAKEAVGGRIALFGNVSPFKTMIDGAPEDVIAESEHLIKTVGRNGGFILAPGCDLDYNVPDANIKALVETAKRFTYPLEVD